MRSSRLCVDRVLYSMYVGTSMRGVERDRSAFGRACLEQNVCFGSVDIIVSVAFIPNLGPSRA